MVVATFRKTWFAPFIALAASALMAAAILSGCTNTASQQTNGSGQQASPKPVQAGVSAAVPLTAVHMFDTGHGWLLDGALYVTTDGGRHWTKAGPPLGTGDNTRGEVVAVAGSRTAWVAVGTSPARGQAWVTLFHTTDGGRSWTKNIMREDLPGRTGGQVPAYLTFADQDHGWLVTQVPDRGMGGVDPGALYHTDDGGSTWHFVSLAGGDTVRFQWLYFVDAATGFTMEGRQANADPGVIAAGSEKLCRTADGGLTWQPSPVPLPVARVIDIKRPVFFNDKDGLLPVLALDAGQGYQLRGTLHLYATADAGATWQPQGQLTIPSPAYDDLACTFLNAQDGWVNWDNKLYGTHDGGETFALIETGLKNIRQLDFVDAQVGWAAQANLLGTGPPIVLYKTGDGGHSWAKQKI